MKPIGKTRYGQEYYGYRYRILMLSGHNIEIKLNKDTVDVFEFPPNGSGSTTYWALQKCGKLDKNGFAIGGHGVITDIKGDIQIFEYLYNYRGFPAKQAFWFEKNRHDLSWAQKTEDFYVDRTEEDYPTFEEVVENMAGEGYYVFDPLPSTEPDEDWYESIHISQYNPQEGVA